MPFRFVSHDLILIQQGLYPVFSQCLHAKLENLLRCWRIHCFCNGNQLYRIRRPARTDRSLRYLLSLIHIFKNFAAEISSSNRIIGSP